MFIFVRDESEINQKLRAVYETSASLRTCDAEHSFILTRSFYDNEDNLWLTVDLKHLKSFFSEPFTFTWLISKQQDCREWTMLGACDEQKRCASHIVGFTRVSGGMLGEWVWRHSTQVWSSHTHFMPQSVTRYPDNHSSRHTKPQHIRDFLPFQR